MMLSDFFVFVFLFDLVGDRTDVSVLGGQLCARTLGWKRRAQQSCGARLYQLPGVGG